MADQGPGTGGLGNGAVVTSGVRLQDLDRGTLERIKEITARISGFILAHTHYASDVDLPTAEKSVCGKAADILFRIFSAANGAMCGNPFLGDKFEETFSRWVKYPQEAVKDIADFKEAVPTAVQVAQSRGISPTLEELTAIQQVARLFKATDEDLEDLKMIGIDLKGVPLAQIIANTVAEKAKGVALG